MVDKISFHLKELERHKRGFESFHKVGMTHERQSEFHMSKMAWAIKQLIINGYYN